MPMKLRRAMGGQRDDDGGISNSTGNDRPVEQRRGSVFGARVICWYVI